MSDLSRSSEREPTVTAMAACPRPYVCSEHCSICSGEQTFNATLTGLDALVMTLGRATEAWMTARENLRELNRALHRDPALLPKRNAASNAELQASIATDMALAALARFDASSPVPETET